MSLNFTNIQYILDISTAPIPLMNILFTSVLCISSPLTAITAWLIIYHTPKRMGNYRFMMLGQMMLNTILMTALFLLQPMPLLPHPLVIATGPLRAIGRNGSAILCAVINTTATNMAISTVSSAAYLISSFAKTTKSSNVLRWGAAKTRQGILSVLIAHTIPSIAIFWISLSCGNEEDQVLLLARLRGNTRDIDVYSLSYSIWGVNPNSSYFYLLLGSLAILLFGVLVANAYFLYQTGVQLRKLRAILSHSTYNSLLKFALLVMFYFFGPFTLIGLPLSWAILTATVLPELAYQISINSFFLFPVFCSTLIFCILHLTVIAPYRKCLLGIFKRKKSLIWKMDGSTIFNVLPSRVAH